MLYFNPIFIIPYFIHKILSFRFHFFKPESNVLQLLKYTIETCPTFCLVLLNTTLIVPYFPDVITKLITVKLTKLCGINTSVYIVKILNCNKFLYVIFSTLYKECLSLRRVWLSLIYSYNLKGKFKTQHLPKALKLR